MKLELGREVRQPAVAERLQRPVGDESTHQVHVCDVNVQVGVLVGDGVTGNDVIFAFEDVIDPVDGFQLEAAVLRELAVPRVVVAFRWINRVV